MASTFSPILRIQLIGTGEQAGTWGDTTNVNLGTLLEQAIAGTATVSVTSGNVTLTSNNGIADQARCIALRITGTPGVSRNIIAPAVSKLYIVANGSNDVVVIKTAASTGITVPVGEVFLVYYDTTTVDFRTVGKASASANTANTLVLRDGSGNFTAGTITAALLGNVTGNVTGDVTGDVTGNVAGNVTGNVSGNLTGIINLTRGTIVQHATTMNLWALANTVDGTGSAVTITAITNAPQGGAKRTLYPLVNTVITDNAMFDVDGGSTYTTLAGDSLEFEAVTVSTYKVHIIKADGTAVAGVLRGFIDGLILSPATTTSMPISAGQATDSTNVFTINLASAITKTTAAWAVGNSNGGIDTGTIANATWYYFYLIRRPDTGVVDVVFSASSTSPTLPTSYTQFRYIGAGLTNGSAQWTAYTQAGNEFYLSTPVIELTGAGSTSAVLLTCTVPRGRKVKAILTLNAIASTAIYLTDPANADIAAQNAAGSGAGVGQGGNGGIANVTTADLAQCWTNTSAQVRYRCVSTAVIGIITNGWIDLRGGNA